MGHFAGKSTTLLISQLYFLRLILSSRHRTAFDRLPLKARAARLCGPAEERRVPRQDAPPRIPKPSPQKLPNELGLPPLASFCYNPLASCPPGTTIVYKLLLCTVYLRTRYLAFVCIVSVMLGVCTLIVVNSVMSGFSNKLKDRLHGILADVLVETERSEGFDEPPEVMAARVRESKIGPHVEAVSPTVEVFALLQFHVMDRHGRKVPITKHVRLIGVDPAKHSKVGQFKEYLVRQHDDPVPSFDLTPEARQRFERNRLFADWEPPARPVPVPLNLPPLVAEPKPSNFLDIPPIVVPPSIVIVPPPALPQGPPPPLPGAILGYSIAHYRYKDPETGISKEVEILRPGDDVLLATVGADGASVKYKTFAVTDYFKSEMSEYDGGFVYVAIDELQQMRGMGNRVNVLQFKLKGDVSNDNKFVHEKVVPEIQSQFDPSEARVASWQQHQGPLLAAIDIERGILNLLLFMIVGVAGFSVLAIFTMIVGEKFRDIGVLKSLGASNAGIMSIFLGYGLMLGAVGCALGTALGLLITVYINEIEAFLAEITGQQIFDRSVYYFDKIPTNVDPMSVVLVNVGAVLTCVLFSVLPALRAARLHPVRALRFE